MRRLAVPAMVLATIVALSVADSSRAATPGAYTGLSSQRLPVTLSVGADGATLSLDIRWVRRCAGPSAEGGRIVRTQKATLTQIAASGEFSWHMQSTDREPGGDEIRERLRLEGHLQPDGSLSGRWRAELDFYRAFQKAVDTTCTTGDVTFTASAGGSTLLPAPFTDAAGNLVTALANEPQQLAQSAGRPWVLSGAYVSGDPLAARTLLTEIDPRTGGHGAPALAPLMKGQGALGAGTDAAFVFGSVYDRLPRVLTARVQVGSHRVRSTRRTADVGVVADVAVNAGGVWLLTPERLLRADPRSGRVVQLFSVPPDRRARSAPRCRPKVTFDHLDASPSAVWATSQTNLDCPPGVRRRATSYFTLSRIDPRTRRVTRSIPLRQRTSGLAAGPADVWLTRCATSRIGDGCHGEAAVCASIPRATHSAAPGPAVDSCGESAPYDMLERVGSGDARPRRVARLPPGDVVGVAADRDAIWITQHADGERQGALRRIAARTGGASTPLTLAGPPSNVVLASGRAWVLDTYERTLIGVAR